MASLESIPCPVCGADLPLSLSGKPTFDESGVVTFNVLLRLESMAHLRTHTDDGDDIYSVVNDPKP